jgi:hypothetical protein
MRGVRFIALQLVAIAALAGGVRAQAPLEPAPQWYLGIGGIVSEPQGEFAQSVGTAGGVAINVRYSPSGAAGFGLRADFGFVRYGSNTQPACFSVTVGCRVQLDVVTANDILLANLGPEWVLPGRGPVRPYLSGSVGLAHFYTHSYVKGVDEHDDEGFGDTTNHKDSSLAWRTGGGILVTLVRGSTPVALDLAAYYHRNGVAEYLTEVDIEDLPGGSIDMFPRRGETNFVSFRLGVSIGLSSQP